MMQRNLKRLVAGLFLGLALAFGAVGASQLAQPVPAVAESCDPGGCTGGGG